MSGPLDMANQKAPSGRERRPTGKLIQLAEAQQAREDAKREAAQRAEQRMKKKATEQLKAAQREQARGRNGGNELSDIPARDPNIITGRDPAFTSTSATTPQLNHRTRTPIVPSAPHNPKAGLVAVESVTHSDVDNDVDINVGGNDDTGDNLGNGSGSGPGSDAIDDFGDNRGSDADSYAYDPQYEGYGQAVDSPPSYACDDNDDLPVEQDKAFPASPSYGDTRPRSPTDLDQSCGLRQPVKIHANTGRRPKIGDYEPAVKVIFNEATILYRGHLCTHNPYPMPMIEDKWAITSWEWGCRKCKTPMAYNEELLTLIKARGSHFRSKIKTRIQPHVKNMYKFVTTSKPKLIEDNIKLARELKDKFAFVFATRGVDGNKGLYHHPIIQQAINEVWFGKKKDDGVVLYKVYNPFPRVALALVLAAIENCIDEWSDGVQANIFFTQEAYESVYHEHLEELNNFHKFTHHLKILPTLLSEIYNDGRLYSKVDPFEKPKRAQSPSAYAMAIEEFKNSGYCDESGNILEDI